MRERYFALLYFGSTSFRVDPLCIGLISALFNHAGSRCSCTFPFAFGLALSCYTILMSHHPYRYYYVLFGSLFNSSSKDFEVHMPHTLEGAWHSLLSSFSCNKNVPSKHPIPLNTPSKSFHSCCMVSGLLFLSLS